VKKWLSFLGVGRRKSRGTSSQNKENLKSGLVFLEWKGRRTEGTHPKMEKSKKWLNFSGAGMQKSKKTSSQNQETVIQSPHSQNPL